MAKQQEQGSACGHYLRPWVRRGSVGATLWASCQNCRRSWFLSAAIPAIAERAAGIEAELVAEQEQMQDELQAAS